MPRFNRTGPEEQGSQTDRGLCKCSLDKQKNNKQERAPRHPNGLGKKRG